MAGAGETFPRSFELSQFAEFCVHNRDGKREVAGSGAAAVREFLFALPGTRNPQLHLSLQDNVAAAVRVFHQKEQSIAVAGPGDLIF